MNARDAMQGAAPAGRWGIASADLQRGVPGLRYPRTMHGAAGAFPQDADYACAIEGPRPGPRGEWWLYAACAVAACAAGALGLVGRLGWLALLIGCAAAAWRISRSER